MGGGKKLNWQVVSGILFVALEAMHTSVVCWPAESCSFKEY